MGKRKLGALEKVEADLTNLQHKIKRDPTSYTEDFRSQYYQYESHREIFLASHFAASSTAANGGASGGGGGVGTAATPGADNGIISLRDLILFISNVADCYPRITADFPNQLIQMLTLHHAGMEPELREKVVVGLVMLRKKNIIDSATLLQNLFPILLATASKSFRLLLFQRIISDLRTSNAKTTNHKLNRTIQTALFNLVTSDRSSSKGLWAVKIIREMWKKQVWTDTRTVEIMKETALAENEKVAIGGVRFFLGGDKEKEELADEDSDDEDVDLGQVRHQVGINKKNKRNTRQIDKAIATVKKKEKKKNAPHPLNFSALQLLHDPQDFAEKLFAKHLQNTKSRLNLEQKLLVLQLVSRLVGLHKLIMLQLYSYFIKYLSPRQPSVTSFLASLAQATHNLVPPEELEPLVAKIANEFVSEAAAAEVASAGLNAIREICIRQPLAINETLLQDLVLYRKSKDKGVVMAARGLLSLYRDVGAEMLKKKDRGKNATMEISAGARKGMKYGEEEVGGGIEGIELLGAWKEQQRKKKRQEKGLQSDEEDEGENENDDEDWAKWEVDSEDDDDSEGWINVASDGEDIEMSDSEDEKDKKKDNENENNNNDNDNDKLKNKKAKTDANDTQDGSTENKDTDVENAREKFTKLATTSILTPADLAKLHELRAQHSVVSIISKNKALAAQQQALLDKHIDDPLTAESIEGPASLSRGKATREERVAHKEESKTERSEHKGHAARKKEIKQEQGKSTTNKEKARQKNFMMTLGKAKKKGKRSLAETGKTLKMHQERQKRGGRRGNW